jgi:hypothetical protein
MAAPGPLYNVYFKMYNAIPPPPKKKNLLPPILSPEVHQENPRPPLRPKRSTYALQDLGHRTEASLNHVPQRVVWTRPPPPPHDNLYNLVVISLMIIGQFPASTPVLENSFCCYKCHIFIDAGRANGKLTACR